MSACSGDRSPVSTQNRNRFPCRSSRLESTNMPMQMDYRITMGVRHNEPEWKRKINGLIRKHQAEINKILLDFGVPTARLPGQTADAIIFAAECSAPFTTPKILSAPGLDDLRNPPRCRRGISTSMILSTVPGEAVSLTMRSASRTASRVSCVTNRTVVGRRCQISSSICAKFLRRRFVQRHERLVHQ